MGRVLVATAVVFALVSQSPTAWAESRPDSGASGGGATVSSGVGHASITLTGTQRQLLVHHFIDEKPDPGSYALASALLPGAGEVALGDWQEPAIIWGALLVASAAVFSLKTQGFGIHPAFLGTTPYVLTFGVYVPSSLMPAGHPDDPNDFFNRFLQIAYLGAAAWTGYRSYTLAESKRARVDQVARPLSP